MKSLLIALSSALALSACAGDYYASNGYPGYAYYGPDSVYYDGYYGPFYDGFWGADGIFVFQPNVHGRFHRDDGHHFRHDSAQGFNKFARQSGHMGGGHGGMHGGGAHGGMHGGGGHPG